MKKDKYGYYNDKVQRNGVRKSFRARTLKELNEKKAAYLMELESSLITKDMPFGKYSGKWLAHIEKTRSYKTYEMYERIVHILNERIGDIPLSKLTSTNFQEVIDEYNDRARTAQQIRQTGKRILKNAINDDLIYKNVCESVILPKYEPKEKKPFNDLEKYAIEHAELTFEERAFVSLLYYTGMRRGEALALTRGNLKKDHIEIKQALTFVDNKGIIKVPKTKTSIRSVPYPELLQDALKNHDFTFYLFSYNGEPFTLSKFRRFWDAIIRKMNLAVKEINELADVSTITPHRFRHNFASVLCENGVSAKEAQIILGHSSITVTMDIYTHLSKEKVSSIDVDSFFNKKIG